MKALTDEYGAAVAARVAAAIACGASPLLTACKDREQIAFESLIDSFAEVSGLISQALLDIELVRDAKPVERADLHIRKIYKCPADMHRPFTLKDAKSRASYAAKLIRQAWEVVDPPIRPMSAA